MKEPRFKKFQVWDKAMDFVEKIYRATAEFPEHELYGLTSQLRRASISVAMNIAEGSGAGSDGEFKRFLNIALRSSYEVICGLEIAQRLQYCLHVQANELYKANDELSATITGLKKSLKADSCKLVAVS